MALALLRADESTDPGRRWFRFDVGSNRFYRYAIGGADRRRQDGITLIAEPTYVSDLAGPLPETAMGMGRFWVDDRQFERGSEFVQMMSYATSAGDNPAVSGIIQARRPLPRIPPTIQVEGSDQPVAFATANSSPRSSALFFADLLKAVAPAIASLVGGISATADAGRANVAGAGSPAAANPLARLADPATLKLLQQLVQQIAGLPTLTPGAGGAQALAVHSEAMIAPALLAALPALAPLLQQVLNPQTIKAVLDAPTQGAATIMNGITDVLKLGLKADEAHMNHLRAIHPGLDDPALNRLMEGLSASRGSADPREAYRRTSRVRLAFDGLRTVTAAGRSRIFFAQGRAVRLPLLVELPRLASGKPPSLPDPSLLLEVKDPVTLEVRQRVRTRLPTIKESGTIEAAELPAGAAAELQPGHDWLFSVTLTWKNSQGDAIGATMSTLAAIAAPAMYDGIVDEGDIFDLDDPTEHRAFWHKIWNGRFVAEAKKFDVEIDYSYRFDPRETATRRVDSRVRTRVAENSVARTEAQVRSGIVYGPSALGDIAAAAGLDIAGPSADELGAFSDAALVERMNLGARLRVPIRGRVGEPFAFWAYPAMRRARIQLVSASEILETGNVAALESHERDFLVPVALNLIGSRGR